MGCHTWFYSKLDPQPNYETIQAAVVKSFKADLELYEQFLDGTLPKDMSWIFDDETSESVKNAICVIKRKIRMIEGGYCKLATATYFACYCNFRMYFSRNTNMFYAATTYHDIFRLGNYPEDELFSLEETLSFIEKHKEEVYFYNDDWKLHLEDFWKKYPDGAIHFG